MHVPYRATELCALSEAFITRAAVLLSHNLNISPAPFRAALFLNLLFAFLEGFLEGIKRHHLTILRIVGTFLRIEVGQLLVSTSFVGG